MIRITGSKRLSKDPASKMSIQDIFDRIIYFDSIEIEEVEEIGKRQRKATGEKCVPRPILGEGKYIDTSELGFHLTHEPIELHRNWKITFERQFSSHEGTGWV